ncbi:hypothetical protein G7Y89_g11270 [Cudoniella acicularis]|uniref:TauD/TfdA-like domain-containing protein n=1 Tax=Cudoniella acicularis TaxID=354080 RepID=A0A8H4RB58_9HELO|nr:hypothetical protein G7Y89_g11270 [Cudoniella acicularis]
MAAAGVLPYELYSDAPGFLFNKVEWEKANASHSQEADFGKVPEGWPKKIEGPLVWDGKDLEAHPETFIRVLSSDEIVEVDAALKSFVKLSLPVSEVTRSTFPLPTLGPALRQLSENIYNGTGVNLLRGFPIQNYSKEHQATIFLGLNSWIGDQRLSQGTGLHIDPSKRSKIFVSAQNTDAQMYHSDVAADIVGLMAISLPESGGESTVSSISQVYNHLAEHRPDIVRLLAEKRFRWRGVGIPDEGVKLIHWFRNNLYLNFSTRTFIGFAEVPDRDPDYPSLTLEEREAFGGFNWIAEQYSLSTALQVGDIEWVNNLHHQHARRGYTESLSSPRHLLRVWLRDSEFAGELPADIQNKFDAVQSQPPDFYPLDELEEDERRRQTGVFTAACKDETAQERLEKGEVVGANN